MSASAESMEELQARHAKEVAELEERIENMLKTAKKSEKSKTQIRTEQMRSDLKTTHEYEIDSFGDSSSSSSVVEDPDESNEPAKEAEANSTAKIQEKIDAKRAKANRKKEKKADKEQQKIEERAVLKAAAGPGARHVEMQQLNQQLAADALQVKEILSDGHCLFRAIADQMNSIAHSASATESSSVPASWATITFADLRRQAAHYLRSNPSEFAPFLGMEESSPEYDSYCNLVEDVAKAEWGGQLELKALANSNEMCIVVYEASSPRICMGTEFSSPSVPPVRLSYHRHYYALGEHYNSVIPKVVTST